MFSIINFWFSSDGKEYHETPETFQMFNEPKMNILSNSNEKDGKSKSSALISIPLQLRFGKFVKMDIKPQSEWLLLSEISFETGTMISLLLILLLYIYIYIYIDI